MIRLYFVLFVIIIREHLSHSKTIFLSLKIEESLIFTEDSYAAIIVNGLLLLMCH